MKIITHRKCISHFLSDAAKHVWIVWRDNAIERTVMRHETNSTNSAFPQK